MKAFLFCMAVFAIFTACKASPPPAASAQESKPADELDAAIRETSDYLNKQLPAKNKLVILNIQSDFPALSEYIIDELIANTVNDRVFSVVDRQQLNTIRAELDFQMSGEVDDDTAQALGRLTGAQIIVSGAVSRIGDLYRLRVRALNVQSAQIEGQFNRNIPFGTTITALVESQATGYGDGSNYGGSGARVQPKAASSGGTVPTGTASASAGSGTPVPATAKPTTASSGGTVPTGTVSASAGSGTPATAKPAAASSVSFAAVTDITSVPTTAMVGTVLTLTGTVVPANATNKAITWTVKSGTATITTWNTLTAAASGTVVVTATIANGIAQGTAFTKDFTVTVTMGTGGNSMSTATTMVDGEWTNGAKISTKGEVDWYKFEATNTKIYFLTWDDRDGSGTYPSDIKVSAFESDGSTALNGILNADSGYSSPKTISGYTGTVYIRVTGTTGAYIIKYDEDIDGTKETATTLVNGVFTSGTGISPAGDVDWYKFEATNTKIYFLTWDDRDGSGTYPSDIKVSAFGSDGIIALNGILNADSGYSSPRIISGYTGTVYIRVTGTTGTYIIKYDEDVDGTKETAITLTNGVWTNNTRISPTGDIDWYKFEATNTKIYFLTWDDRDGSGTYPSDIKVSAFESDGSTALSGILNADSGYSSPKTISGYTGTVYIKVTGSTGTYAIKVTEQ
ncbi:CsgG/HfaB family protein [Breznakiellaceae bacterium SP9]